MFRVPSDEEMQQIAFIEDARPREDFGNPLPQLAIDAFVSGDHAEAARLLEWMVKANADDAIRNNYAYCLIVLGRLSEADEQFRRMRFSKKDDGWALWTHNRGVLASLAGDRRVAIQCLRESIERLKEVGDEGRDVVCMLVLKDGGRRVCSRADIGVLAAALVNLRTLDADPRAVDSELAARWPTEYQTWLGWASGGEER